MGSIFKIYLSPSPSCCLDSASEALPNSTSTHKKGKCIPGWSEHVKPFKDDAIFWQSVWRSCGSPSTGVVASIRRRTRALYRRAIKNCIRKRDQTVATEMASALLVKDNVSFWNIVRKTSRVGNSIPSSIDGICGVDNIANTFADKYESLYNSAVSSDSELSQIHNDLHVCIDRKCKNGTCSFDHSISRSDVALCVQKLKSNKSDGISGHNSNHLIHGTELLFGLLSKLISCMFNHGYSSTSFRKSVIFPIVKNKQKSASDSNNYRGIALTSVISKLVDIIIIDKQPIFSKSSDLQFGFKDKSSTTQCTFVMNEVIEYYLRNGGQVYTTFLDASKAFDCVKFSKLFKLLLDRDICPLIARFLAYCYTHQTGNVKWNSTMSKEFDIRNGVKQGGVLSPLLFNIYIDVLLLQLSQGGIGCHIGKKYMGSFAYADDIVLLSPSVSSLKLQLEICHKFSQDYNIKFNAEKSKLIIYGGSPVSIEFQGRDIPICTSEKHVGNLVGSDHEIKQTIIRNACNDMYSRLNLLMQQFKCLDRTILYKLFNSFCLSLYGCQLWLISSSRIMEPLYTAWRKCIRRIFGLPYTTHCNLLPIIANDHSIEFKLHKRFLNFFDSLCNSKNSCVNLCIKLLGRGSQSIVSSSWSYLCYTYDIVHSNVDYFSRRLYKFKYPVPSEDLKTKGSLIRDLVLYHHDNMLDLDVLELINHLCTD